MCLILSLVLNLKHILSNEAVIDDVLEDCISWVAASKRYGEALRPTFFVDFSHTKMKK